MKLVYTGPSDEITFRGVTFKKDKGVDVECENLAAKLDALDYFKRAPGRPKKKTEDD